LGPASKKLLDNLFIFNPDAGILQESFSRLIDLFDVGLSDHPLPLKAQPSGGHNSGKAVLTERAESKPRPF
jgi:hypothetical protein